MDQAVLIKNSYYYLVTGLSELHFGHEKLPVTQHDFLEFLRDNMPEEDFELVKYFFLRYDQYNLLNLLEQNDKPFDERGLFKRGTLEQLTDTKETSAIEVPEGDFYEHLRNLAVHYRNDIPLYPQLNWANQFTNAFYDFVKECGNAFLCEWFAFEMNFTNMVTAFTAERHQKDNNDQIIGQNEVSEAIKNIKAKDFGLGHDYPYIESILDLFENSTMLERERGLDRIKWDKLDEMTTFYYFAVENVLAYMIRIQILERWQQLDEQKGKEIFERIIQDLKNSYEFPEYFVV